MPASSLKADQPLVSIILPCHLGTLAQAELLNQTLQTVSAQTCPDYEIILVDDGSPVPVEPVAATYPRTTTVHQDNAGPAVARNTGVDRSRGRNLIFLDADDHLLPCALAAGLDALEGHPEAGFAVGPREEMTFEGKPVPWHVPPPPPQAHIYLPLLRFDWYIIPPSSVMFRRQVVEAIGGFRDPWVADDLDFYLRVAHRFTACRYQAPAVTRYRRYSTSSSRDGERMLHSIRSVYARQWALVKGDPEAESAYHHGLGQLTDIFLDCVVENIEDRLRSGNCIGALRSARLLLDIVGLVQQLKAMPPLFGQDVAVAGCQHYRKLRIALPDLPAQLDTAHPRHHHVREHHIEPAGVLLDQLESLIGVRGPCGLVPKILEKLGRELAHLNVVLDHQNTASAAVLILIVSTRVVSGTIRCTVPLNLRQVERKRCALAELTLDSHIAAGLLGEAVDLTEAQAYALAHLFGGEERLEDLAQLECRIPCR